MQWDSRGRKPGAQRLRALFLLPFIAFRTSHPFPLTPIHQGNAPVVKRAAPSGNLGPVLCPCRQGTGAARDQHAVGPPSDVALAAADDLSLALARLRQRWPCEVFLRATLSAHPSQADHVQRTVGLPVTYSRLRRCRTTLPEEASMGAPQHRLAKGEASLLDLWGLSPAERAEGFIYVAMSRLMARRLACP